MRAATLSCASLPTTRSIDVSSLGEPPHRVKRGKPKMALVSTPRHTPRPDMRKPLRIPNHPFIRTKYFSPGHRPLVARNRLSVSTPHHLWHGRNIFRPYVRAWYSVARSPPWALSIINMFAKIFASPIIHLSGRNIFRPDVCHWWRVTAYLFLPHITFCKGEKYFAPTFAIVTPSPDRRPGRCQSSICSQTSSHLQSSICRGEIFFARTSAIGGA